MVNKVGGKGGKSDSPKFAQELNSAFYKSTSYEASTSDEKLQRMLDKNAELEEALGKTVNGSDSHRILAEQLAFSEEETYQHSLKVDKILTDKAKKIYAKGYETQSRVSNITRNAITASGTERFISQARGSQELNLPQSVIESRIQESIAKTSSYTEGIANRIRSLKPGDDTDDIVKASAGIGKYRDETARWMAIKTEQNRAGLSARKLTGRYEDIKEDLSGFRSRTETERKLASGEHKSFAEESATLNKKESLLGEAFEKLSNTVKEAGESFDDFNKRTMDATKEFTKLADEVEKQATLTKGVERKEGGGGGGFFQKNQALIQMAQMGLQTVGTVAGAYEDIAVHNDITQVSNRAKFAKMGNAIYDQATSAVSGYNVDAMLDIAGDAGVKRYADMQKAKTNVANGVKTVANGAADIAGSTAKGVAIGTAAGVALASGTAFFTGGTGTVAAPAIIEASAALGGTLGAASAVSRSAVDVDNLVKGNVGANTSISAYHARKELNREERYVASQNMQAFYSQGINSYSAIQGMGSSASGAMQNKLMDSNELRNVAFKGISPEEAVKLSGILSTAGSMEGGADAGMRIIEGAGRASQRGQMGKEEYVSTAARMVAAGGKDKELEDIIASGMTKGMDNSLNISQMVGATIQMSSDLASKGISGTGAVAGLVGASTQFLADQGVNKNLATGAAVQDIANYDKGITDTGFNLGGIMQRAGLRNMSGLKGASVFQMNNVSSLSMEDLAVLQKGGEEGNLLARRLGVDDMLYKNGEPNSSLITDVGKQAFNKLLINNSGMGLAEGKSLMNKWGKPGVELDSKERALLKNFGSESAFFTAGGINKVDMITDENYNKIGLNQGAAAQRTKALYESDKVGQGRIAAGEMLGTQQGKEFEGLEGLAKSITEAVDPAKWGDEVKAAADGFSVPAANFVKATGQLDETVKRLIEHQNKMLDKMGESRGTDIPSEEKPSWWSSPGF